MRLLIALLALAPLVRAAAPVAPAVAADPRQWLEEIDSPRALDWVKKHNKRSLSELEADPRYRSASAEARAILLAEDRIPAPELRGRWIYNFWQDAKSVRGVWRRTTPEQYRKAAPRWETVLDLDALAAAEKENWVWKGADCLSPEQTRCLIMLSRGGGDAVVQREFDAERKAFVVGGFFLPEAKSDESVAWLDADTLLVGTDFGPGSLTKAGYPRVIKRWRRGDPLASAPTLYEGKEDDVQVSLSVSIRPDGKLGLVERYISFFEEEVFALGDDGALKPVPLPRTADLQGYSDGRVFARLRQPWAVAGSTIPAGALIAWPVGAPVASIELVWTPDEHSSLQSIVPTRSELYLDTLSNVQGVILRARREGSVWRVERLPFPEATTLEVAAWEPSSDLLLVKTESFLTPTTLLGWDAGAAEPATWRRVPARFDAKGLAVSQRWATSKDGTKVPYFLVRRGDAPFDGKTPTLLYGYGGFEASETPLYSGVMGKLWLEKGGAYALANIRGGGEFGPRWHEAAIKENRQRAYDDFEAVAQDLIDTKETSPRRLGIMGGSNGGLLMGVALTQRPELFNAVVCQVPLADMLRYDQLLAGHSWVGEYGSPSDPAMAAALRGYSPYHNVREGVRYPRPFVLTSTKDDRVHPGHARKLVARLEEVGAPVLYFENIEGGHSAAANLEQRIHRHALEYAYLYRQLFD